MKKIVTLFAAMALALSAQARMVEIYSWIGGENEEETTEVGGTATGEQKVSGNDYSNRVNFKQDGKWVISLIGNQDFYQDPTKTGTNPDQRTQYVKIVLNEALTDGDKIYLTGFTSTNNAGKVANVALFFINGDGKIVDQFLEPSDSYPNIKAGIEGGAGPETHEIRVPANANKCKEIHLSRNKSGSNVSLTKVVIVHDTDNAGVDDVLANGDANAPVEYYTTSGVRVANPAPGQIVIRRQGSKVSKTIVRR